MGLQGVPAVGGGAAVPACVGTANVRPAMGNAAAGAQAAPGSIMPEGAMPVPYDEPAENPKQCTATKKGSYERCRGSKIQGEDLCLAHVRARDAAAQE